MEKKSTRMMKVLGVVLVALTGTLAWADETTEEVVAYGESAHWLGPDEILVAYGETNFELVVFRDLPPNPTEADIRAAIEAAHMKDQERILAQVGGSADRYREFRRWMAGVGEQAVAKSEFAWLSFALDLGTLLESAIEDNDLKVEEFNPTAEAGKFDFTVGVEGVEVGSEASEENLKKVFGLEGATSLGEAQGDGALPTIFSADAVDITFGTPVDGKVKFTAGPQDADAKTFFMKVKVK